MKTTITGITGRHSKCLVITSTDPEDQWIRAIPKYKIVDFLMIHLETNEWQICITLDDGERINVYANCRKTAIEWLVCLTDTYPLLSEQYYES